MVASAIPKSKVVIPKGPPPKQDAPEYVYWDGIDGKSLQVVERLPGKKIRVVVGWSRFNGRQTRDIPENETCSAYPGAGSTQTIGVLPQSQAGRIKRS